MPKQNFSRRSRVAALLVSSSLLLFSARATFAWGAGGHMMVAYVAYKRLNPKAKAEVDRLLKIPINPAKQSKASSDFVNASHWADDVKRLPGFEFSPDQHFVDQPFSVDGTPLPADLPKANNIVKALQDNVNTLKTSTDDNARAQALRFIIHFVGDIHQPLHCSTRVDKAHTDGDQGGNLFVILIPASKTGKTGKTRREKLHAYWDGGFLFFPPTGKNFKPPRLSSIPAAASAALKGNPDTDADLKLDDPTDFQTWADESSKLAQTDAYDGLKPNKLVGAAYRTHGLKVARQRVAWAGYRLAALLNSIFPQ
jgi:hypothetical protein